MHFFFFFFFHFSLLFYIYVYYSIVTIVIWHYFQVLENYSIIVYILRAGLIHNIYTYGIFTVFDVCIRCSKLHNHGSAAVSDWRECLIRQSNAPDKKGKSNWINALHVSVLCLIKQTQGSCMVVWKLEKIFYVLLFSM